MQEYINRYCQANGITKVFLYRNPSWRNPKGQGQTAAMLLASKGFIPPKKLQHNPNLKDNDGYTVQMYLAIRGIDAPKEWCQRNSRRKNRFGETYNDIVICQNSFPTFRFKFN